MTGFVAFECRACGTRTAPEPAPRYACPSCAFEALDVVLDYAQLRATVTPQLIGARRDPSLWRYRELLPVGMPKDDEGPLRQVGGTPLYLSPRASARVGGGRIWIKDDGRLPTGSFKDRASAIVVMRARELGVDRIITASTGNAGVAIAAMARAAGQRAVVLVPASAPPAKIAQLMIFGAELYLVRGNYDDAFRLSRAASRELGWYCRNTGYNPFTVEGKKTVAFELAEQLACAQDGPEPARWRAPDRVYVSVGDGNIIAAVHKGFRELLELGFIERMPRLFGVQASGSAAIATTWRRKDERIDRITATTLADSISADMPSDGLRALRAVRDTGGEYVVVEDAAILEAMVALAADATVFAEPAAATAYAGLIHHAREAPIPKHEDVVVLVTGSGLKDVAAATRAVGAAPSTIDPSMDALRRALAKESP
ncbi:MAG: threonine synthase [Myxococcales bacterium]|nr:threonine synthase [Myxococcales bacterium]